MILVTGGTGMVGGHLLWHLLQENERVSAIRRTKSNLKPLRAIFCFYTSKPDDYLARIDWEIADVLDEASIQKAMQNVRLVYHCAAVVSFENNAGILLDTNVRGTRNVVQAALENSIEKLCFVSSIAACGNAANRMKIDEKTVWTAHTNRSVYSRSKFYSEQEVWIGIEQGLNTVIVNPGVILGVSGNDTGSSQLFAQVQKGLMFYTNGGTGYIDIKDVVSVMIALMKSNISAERFVLVSENCSNKDTLSWMADGFGKRRPFIPVGKSMLLFVGILSEFFGKIFSFSPIIDREIARTATQRKYFSSGKIEDSLGCTFTPIAKSIREICDFRKKYCSSI